MNARLRLPHGAWLAQVVCLAAAVYLVGWLGRVLIVSSGELVSLWTASGVALAALLFFGNRIWPGAWLGSFLLEITAAFKGTDTHVATVSLVVAISVATATVLQAAAGSWLIRRGLGKVPTLDSVNEVLAVMGLGNLDGFEEMQGRAV